MDIFRLSARFPQLSAAIDISRSVPLSGHQPVLRAPCDDHYVEQKRFKRWPEIFNTDSILTAALPDAGHPAETLVIEGPSCPMRDHQDGSLYRPPPTRRRAPLCALEPKRQAPDSALLAQSHVGSQAPV